MTRIPSGRTLSAAALPYMLVVKFGRLLLEPWIFMPIVLIVFYLVVTLDRVHPFPLDRIIAFVIGVAPDLLKLGIFLFFLSRLIALYGSAVKSGFV
jgi:hypothetical protein